MNSDINGAINGVLFHDLPANNLVAKENRVDILAEENCVGNLAKENHVDSLQVGNLHMDNLSVEINASLPSNHGYALQGHY